MSIAARVFTLAVLMAFSAGCSPSPDKKPDTANPPHDNRPKTNREGDDRQAIFIDVTEKCGFDFVHFNGTTGEFYLPEITGSGGALLDYDNDGDLDLYAVQGAYLLSTDESDKVARWQGDGPPRDRLFRNELIPSGELRFTDVTRVSGIDATGYGMGVATSDFDNDGHVDLYVTNLGSNQLWKNKGDGTFEDVTIESGTDDERWSTSATFFDYDRDGWLDLFVTNYVDFSTKYQRRCFDTASRRDYCGPDSYDAVTDRLFHNRGDGTFEDVTAKSGIRDVKQIGAGLGVVAADLNGDGWTDIYVTNDGDPNHMWINDQGSGRFKDESLLAGTALNGTGQPEAGMGVDAADFDHDGDEDLFMTHLERESNTLYVNLGEGTFDDATIQRGLHAASLPYTSFGTRFVDYDNDGWLDLIVLNGAVRVIDALARKGETYPLRQPNQLFQNRNGKNGREFIEVKNDASAAFRESRVSRGAALGDVDNDGDVDLVEFNSNGPARLLINQVGNQQHWLGLRVLEQDNQRDAIQARVEVVLPGGQSQWHRVHTDGSYCSASDPRLVVGLGQDKMISAVRVHWTEAKFETWQDLAIDQYHSLQRGTGVATAGGTP